MWRPQGCCCCYATVGASLPPSKYHIEDNDYDYETVDSGNPSLTNYKTTNPVFSQIIQLIRLFVKGKNKMKANKIVNSVKFDLIGPKIYENSDS